MVHCLNLLTIILLLSVCYAVRPQDGVYFPSLNQTYYLANETYSFDLVPGFFVPMNVHKHIIYTSSQDSLLKVAKRYIFEKRHALFDFSEEDHSVLSGMLYKNDLEKVPPFLRVNKKKRSLGFSDEGIGEIPLMEGISILHFGHYSSLGLKRSDKIQFGTKFCLAVPAVTTCSDDGGTEEVKNAIKGAVNEIRAELDSYTSTNNLREKVLSDTLDRQRVLTQKLAALSGNNLANTIPEMVEHQSLNVVNLAHGDYVAQSQINYLKRSANGLLRYLKAMASTDARQIVAQPSLSQLFTGYQAVLSLLSQKGYIPITENRTFTWTELPLPVDVTPNIAWPPSKYLLLSGSQPRTFRGMDVFINLYDCTSSETQDSVQCNSNTYPEITCKCTNDPATITLLMDQVNMYQFYGPLPTAFTGIYILTNKMNATNSLRYIAYPTFRYSNDSLTGDRVSKIKLEDMTPTNWYCIQFGPYIGLANFASTPKMLNGAPAGYLPLNDSRCDSLRLRSATGNTIYSLFVVKEKVIIPFYSNCTAKQLISQGVITSAKRLGYYSDYPIAWDFGLNATFNYTKFLVAGTPGVMPNDPPVGDVDRLTDYDMYQYHMISDTCAINMDPEWIGGNYYKKKPTLVIPDIPTGFKFNQFTINSFGEISSSLEFVYTTNWLQTYKIIRSSNNSMITDEVDILDGTQVLFYVNKNTSTVIDEANYFFGEGNNGRDCIHRSTDYTYDLTSCNYQNDLLQYDASNYFLGLQKTSGVARFIDKYEFSFSTKVVNFKDQYSFTLIPKSDSDFRFYIESDGTICPKLVDKVSTTNQCTFTFVYNGTEVVSFGPWTSVVFDNQHRAVVDVAPGVHSLKVKGTQECMLIQCRFTLTQSVIQLEPPDYDLLSSSDLALETKIYYTIDEMVNGTLSQLNDVVSVSEALYQQNLQTQEDFAQLNFSLYLLHQYENFSSLRASVDEYIDAIAPKQPEYSLDFDSCDFGIFGSPGCFFSNLLSSLITILIIIGVCVGLYCVCFKLGVGKMIIKKLAK